jgi:hypothetical protein
MTRLRIAHSSGSGLPSVRCSTEMNVAKQQAVSDLSKLAEIRYPPAMQHAHAVPSPTDAKSASSCTEIRCRVRPAGTARPSGSQCNLDALAVLARAVALLMFVIATGAKGDPISLGIAPALGLGHQVTVLQAVLRPAGNAEL